MPQPTELMFPDRRAINWLRARGLGICGAVFLLGAVVGWYEWTQKPRVQVFHMAPYSPPRGYLLIGSAGIVLLIVAALALRSTGVRARGWPWRSAPTPWMVGIVSCVLGAPWTVFGPLSWGVGTFKSFPFQLVLLVGSLGWLSSHSRGDGEPVSDGVMLIVMPSYSAESWPACSEVS